MPLKNENVKVRDPFQRAPQVTAMPPTLTTLGLGANGARPAHEQNPAVQTTDCVLTLPDSLSHLTLLRSEISFCRPRRGAWPQLI